MISSNTRLQAKNIACVEHELEEFPELLFGADTNGNVYFDATDYLQSKYPDSNFTVQDFFQKMDYIIQCILETYEIERNEALILNQDGHQLIIGYLCYPFLSYTDRKLAAYINSIIHEVFINDFAVSDKYIVNTMRKRFSKELLQKLISE